MIADQAPALRPLIARHHHDHHLGRKRGSRAMHASTAMVKPLVHGETEADVAALILT
jgi:hypothetical protein